MTDVKTDFPKGSARTTTLSNGLKMPLVALGMWQIVDEADVEQAMNSALDSGYRHFDTATLYGNEEQVGRVLSKWFASGRVKREELFITTKLPWNGMSPELVERFLNSALRRLQLDYVDLYLIHWPIGVVFTSEEEPTPMDENGSVRYDLSTNLERIWGAMEGLVEAGKAKSIGLSNFNSKQIERILNVAEVPPANLQIEAHAYFQNRSLCQFAKSKNISVCAYSVLGSPGRAVNSDAMKGWKFECVPPVLQDESVQAIAKKHSKTAAQVLLRFLVQQGIAVLPKSTNPQRIKENINIFDFQLDNEDIKAMEQLEKGDTFRSFLCFTDADLHPEFPWKNA